MTTNAFQAVHLLHLSLITIEEYKRSGGAQVLKAQLEFQKFELLKKLARFS